MRRVPFRRLGAIACSLLASSCLIASAPVPNACLPVVAMSLVIPKSGEAMGESQIALAEDGTITRHGKPLGRLVADRVVDTRGDEIASCSADHSLSFHGSSLKARFSSDDEFVDSDGTRVIVDDNGTPVMAPSGVHVGRTAPGKFTPFDPKARRTAVMLLLLAMMRR